MNSNGGIMKQALFSTAIMVGLISATAQAATNTWGNTATNWNDPSSWVGGQQPGSGDAAIFTNATVSFQPNITASTTISNLQFTTNGWTLSSDSSSVSLTLMSRESSGSNRAILNAGSNTITAPLIFGGNGAQYIRSSPGPLTIAGSITKSDSGVLDFSQGTLVSGNITAAGKVSSQGGLTLSGSNSAGSWDMQGSYTYIRSAGALGSSGAINFSGGYLFFTSSNATDYSSRFTVTAGKNFCVAGEQISVTATLASALSGNGGFVVGASGGAGPGTIILGNAGNSFTGSVAVMNGALSVAGIGNAGSNSYLGTSGTINFGLPSSSGYGTLIYTGAGETSDKVIILNSTTGGGTIQADNASGVLKFTRALVTTIINNTAARTLTLQGTGNGELAGAIADGSTTNVVLLTKAGTGLWTLSGTNTYTGATAVNGGVLVFAGTAAKATATATAAAAGTIGLGVGGAGYYSSADVDALFSNTLSGFSMNASSGVGIDTTAGDFTYATSLTTNRFLHKTGPNTLFLTGSNTNTKGATVWAGTLAVGHASALGTGGANTVRSNATLAVSAGVTFARAVTFTNGATLAGQGTYATNNWTTPAGLTLKPGLPAGVLTVDVGGAGKTLTLGADNVLRIVIQPDGTYGKLFVNGGLDISAPTARLVVTGPMPTAQIVLAEGTAQVGQFQSGNVDLSQLTGAGTATISYTATRVLLNPLSRGTVISIR
jgi:autotransporter-associated beta strand protein